MILLLTSVASQIKRPHLHPFFFTRNNYRVPIPDLQTVVPLSWSLSFVMREGWVPFIVKFSFSSDLHGYKIGLFTQRVSILNPRDETWYCVMLFFGFYSHICDLFQFSLMSPYRLHLNYGYLYSVGYSLLSSQSPNSDVDGHWCGTRPNLLHGWNLGFGRSTLGLKSDLQLKSYVTPVRVHLMSSTFPTLQIKSPGNKVTKSFHSRILLWKGFQWVFI